MAFLEKCCFKCACQSCTHTAEAVKSSKSLPEEVDVRSLLQDRRSRLKHFFTNRSKEAPCISMTRVQPLFGSRLITTVARPKEKLED